MKSPWKPSSDVNPSWRCPKSWSYPQFSIFLGSGFSMKTIQLGVSPMTMRPSGPGSPGRVPLRRLYQLAGPGRWYSTHGWSRERAQGGERWKEGPGLQWENWIEIRGKNGIWWDFRVWILMDFMAFYGLKYDLTDNYGVGVGIIFQ